MSYDVKANTVTVGDHVYAVEEEDGDHPVARTLTIDELPEVSVEIRYEQDGSFCDPRDACNVGMMLCEYRDYNLGDGEPPSESDLDVECDACEGSGYVAAGSPDAADRADPGDEDGSVTCRHCDGGGTRELGLIEFIKREHDATVILPLYVYDHSGITIKAGQAGVWDPRGQFVGDDAGWDTSLVGMIFDTKSGREETGVKPEDVEEALRGEVREYARWLEGDVYYILADAPGYDEPAYGGLIGHEWALDQAYETLSEVAEFALHERSEVAEWAARDVVTVAA